MIPGTGDFSLPLYLLRTKKNAQGGDAATAPEASAGESAGVVDAADTFASDFVSHLVDNSTAALAEAAAEEAPGTSGTTEGAAAREAGVQQDMAAQEQTILAETIGTAEHARTGEPVGGGNFKFSPAERPNFFA
eukprot:TRINITY_DN64460_c0_g1_i1.p1 TRINITY_DN64460_c0_g1~~TRINITY_DN64460_c0_g1_i1.p1  ORF type:complete len:134 (+),score=29.12 TRINITY_DN64460_c0_g1_i1:81-482(+)